MAQLDWYIRANLKPRHLQLLVALDDLRNLGKVATAMHVSQPAISLALGELERGLGLQLFERTARGVNPTVYGECMIRHARTLIGTLAQTRDELRSLMTGASGRVALGALPATAPALVPLALARLKRSSPTTTVAVHEGSMDLLLPALRRGHLDFIVGRLNDDAIGGQDLMEKPLIEGASSLVVRPGHPLTRRRRLDWTDLATHAWVLPPGGSLSREPLEAALQRHGVALSSDIVETLSPHVILTYLQQSDAVGVLSRVVARHYQALDLLHELPLTLPTALRPIGLTWRKDAALSPSALALMQMLEATSAALDAAPTRAGARRVARPRVAPAAVALRPGD